MSSSPTTLEQGTSVSSKAISRSAEETGEEGTVIPVAEANACNPVQEMSTLETAIHQAIRDHLITSPAVIPISPEPVVELDGDDVEADGDAQQIEEGDKKGSDDSHHGVPRRTWFFLGVAILVVVVVVVAAVVASGDDGNGPPSTPVVQVEETPVNEPPSPSPALVTTEVLTTPTNTPVAEIGTYGININALFIVIHLHIDSYYIAMFCLTC